MPHIIIEYSDDTISPEGTQLMLDKVFEAVEETGLFQPLNIKVRAIPVSYYRLGSAAKGFIHIQCRIHVGRAAEQKKYLTETIVSALQTTFSEIAVITAEVTDMDRGSYSKYSRSE